MSENPIRLEVTKWRRASKKVEPPKQSDKWMGGHFLQVMQLSAGRSNNSGPTGNKVRWYIDRAWRKALGKHGIKRLRDRIYGLTDKEKERVAALKTKAHGQADLIKGLKL